LGEDKKILQEKRNAIIGEYKKKGFEIVELEFYYDN